MEIISFLFKMFLITKQLPFKMVVKSVLKSSKSFAPAKSSLKSINRQYSVASMWKGKEEGKPQQTQTQPAQNQAKTQPAAKKDVENMPFETRTIEDEYQLVKSKFNSTDADVRYAWLFYSAYEGYLHTFQDDIDALSKEYMTEGSELYAVVSRDNLTSRQRYTIFEKYGEKSKLSSTVRAFLQLLAENGRLNELPIIMGKLEEIVKTLISDSNTINVITAQKLSADQVTKLKNMIIETFKPGKPVELKEIVNPELGGGYEIYYDRYYMDNSRKTVVAEMNKEIQTSVREYISKLDSEKRAAYRAATQTG